MFFEQAYIPYGGYWSTPFCRWQGSLAHLNAVAFAAEITRQALESRGISPQVFDSLYLGITVPQKHSFYGGPWLAGLIGAEAVTGPIISQACATSARVVGNAAAEVEVSGDRTILTITADRCSNGPHIYYPNPLGPGGMGDKEDWVWDNFGFDPFARNAMIETAENVAREAGITREEQDEMTLLRYQQYSDALKDDANFLHRFMVIPLEVKDERGRKVLATLDGDEGVFPTTAEGLARLKPVVQGGTVTYGTQTHPADGNCGIIIATQEKARELSRNPQIEIQVMSYGEGRARKGYMAQAIVPAAQQALSRAGISLADVRVIKTHNPFAVNDIYFCREMGVKPAAMNNYGSSLIFGHPQGPTGHRLIIEMIEELVMVGGGYGLFVGCAAGDTGAGVVIKVSG
ncbi:MAG: thiolase family protein [Chloroflexi bacterium]|nr:thiolase family protein [Chloroflexota bacterium]MBU1747683.1 thiolase family protein [Chloroflexota bacterium]